VLIYFLVKNAFIVSKSNKCGLPVVPLPPQYFTVYYLRVRLSFILSPLFIVSYFLSPLLPISFTFSFCYFLSPFSALYFFFSVFPLSFRHASFIFSSFVSYCLSSSVIISGLVSLFFFFLFYCFLLPPFYFHILVTVHIKAPVKLSSAFKR